MSFENPNDDEILIALTLNEAKNYRQFKRTRIATPGAPASFDGARFKTAYYTCNAARLGSQKFWDIAFRNAQKTGGTFAPIMESWQADVPAPVPNRYWDILIVADRQEALLYPGFHEDDVYVSTGQLGEGLNFVNAYYTPASVREGTDEFWWSFYRWSLRLQPHGGRPVSLEPIPREIEWYQRLYGLGPRGMKGHHVKTTKDLYEEKLKKEGQA